jgi:hypothetical protein
VQPAGNVPSAKAICPDRWRTIVESGPARILDKIFQNMVSPDFLKRQQGNQPDLTDRQLARARQALVEKERLIRHQRIAMDLLTLPAKDRDALVERAAQVVAMWRQEKLCSADYIDRWSEILRLPPREMADAIVSDADGWGAALRQNSPWVGVFA